MRVNAIEQAFFCLKYFIFSVVVWYFFCILLFLVCNSSHLAGNPLSTQQNHLDHQTNGDYHTDDETERSLLGTRSKHTQRPIPIKLAPIDLHHERHQPPASNLIDINAMSIASIYDQENNDIMDADM